ncbi:hypothetical protein FS749_008879 [Ceratobasidium sp. UAMH 11750]|nr:hypothetical protein FS749_008879 [Ceratobasidium sp. UAMH 11750]
MPSISSTMYSRLAAVGAMVSNLVSYIYVDDYLAPSPSAQLDHIGGLLREAKQMLESSKDSLEDYEQTLAPHDHAAFIAQHRTFLLGVAEESSIYRTLVRGPGQKDPDRPLETIDLEAFRNRVVELHTVISTYDEDVWFASKSSTAKHNSPQLAPTFPDDEAGGVETLSPLNAYTSSAATRATSTRKRSERSGATSVSRSLAPDYDLNWYTDNFALVILNGKQIANNEINLGDEALNSISALRQRWSGRLVVRGIRVLNHGREYLSMEDAIENFEDFGTGHYPTTS